MTGMLTITTAAELEKAWRFIDGGHGYSAEQLFALAVQSDGKVIPHIVQLYDDAVAQEPDDALIATLLRTIHEACLDGDPMSSIAVMRARPGGPDMSPRDVRWCRARQRGLAAAPITPWPVWFATSESLGPVPADALIDAA